MKREAERYMCMGCLYETIDRSNLRRCSDGYLYCEGCIKDYRMEVKE